MKQHIDFNTYLPFLLVSVANAITRSASRTYNARFGVGVTEWRILANVAVRPGVTARDICRTSSLDKAAVSRAAALLSQRRLIVIEEAEDRRERRITLTAAGQELHDQMLQVALAREAQLLQSLTGKDRAMLIRILNVLRDAAVGPLDIG